MIALDRISLLLVWSNRTLRQSAVVLLILLIVGCGSHPNRELVSVTVTPSVADAQNFPSGQVQFVATGIFSQPPMTSQLSSQDITWCIGSTSGHCAGFIETGAIVNANGLASCNSGFSGVVTVLAGKPEPQPSMPDVGFQLHPFGSAQLTCP